MKKYLTKCHPDFHIPGDAIVGENFDAGDYVKRLKDSYVDSVVFFGKCHYGFSYYPTEIGTVHPGLKKDMLGEIVECCRKEEMGISIYYSVFLDTEAVRKHPNWKLAAESMEIEGGFNSKKFESVCVNSGYIEQLLIPQSLEIIKNYDINEMFFDTMTGFNPCYCDQCKKSFGKAIPLNKDDPNWLEYVKWYKRCYDDCFKKITKAIYDFNPTIIVTFNWQWSANQPNAPVPYIRNLAGDLFPSGSVSSFFSHYWTGTDFNFDYMCGRFMHGLSDWSNNLPETLKYTAAATIANGGSFYLIDRQLPNGKLEERAWPLIKDVFCFVQERRDVVESTRHFPETAVLYSYDHIMGAELEYFPDVKKREQRKAPFVAFSKIMMTRGHHYTALSKENLNFRMSEYSIIVLPEIDYLDDYTKENLIEYVKAGGKLLIIQSGTDAGVDEDILQLAGVCFEKHSDLNYGYIDYDKLGNSEPILVRGKFAFVTPIDNTQILYNYIQPMNAGLGGAEFGHGFAPPDAVLNYAAVTKRKVAQGEVIYVSAPVLSSFEEYFNPHITDLIVRLKEQLLPDPIIRIETQAQVEMVVVEKENDLIVHLINHSGKEILAGGWCPVVEYIPEIRDIKVKIKTDKMNSVVISEPDGKVLQAEYGGSFISVTVPSLHIMSSLRIKNYLIE